MLRVPISYTNRVPHSIGLLRIISCGFEQKEQSHAQAHNECSSIPSAFTWGVGVEEVVQNLFISDSHPIIIRVTV